MRAKRYFFRDEEPEEDSPWFNTYGGMCEFCGHEDHRQDKCPNKPLPKGTSK